MATYQISIEKNNRREIIVEEISPSKKDVGQASGDKKEESNPLFHEEYLKARRILESFTKDKNLRTKEGQKSSTPPSYGPKNNIIVFTGDRGTGKTSAMVSFGKYLEKHGLKELDQVSEKNNCIINCPIEERFNSKDDTCILLDMIDPSYFRKNESILLNVITLMFKMAKEYHRSCNSQYHEDCIRYKNEESNASDFNKLLEEFEKVFRSVKKMDSIVPKEDSLEYLNELSDAIDLNKSIHNLIDKFLRFFKGTPRYLVLMIDDLDMNVAYAATMLEQIRKFLIQDNVIILIATNVDQLQFEMKESYSKYYDKTLHPYQQQANVSVDVEDMANKYLLKLFPPLQRIHISDAANKLIDTKLKIEDIKDEEGNHVFNDYLQKVVLNLIWKKTRLIFIPEKGQLHPIIPTNLRALHQLVYILLDMEDLSKDCSDKIFKDKEDYEKAQVNFNKFKDYILNVWIPSNVSFEEQKVFDNIPSDISRINKHLIQSINIIGSKYKKSILAKEIDPKELHKNETETIKFDRDIYTFVSPNDPKFPHANKISDVINFPSNNAAGDILLLIDKYKTYFEAANQNNFIDAVKIYYSLLLFETMFFKSTVKEISEGLKKYIIEDVKNISNIQRLIGGTLFFPHYFTIIKSSDYEELREKKKKKEEELIKISKELTQKEKDSPSDIRAKKVKKIIEEDRNKSSENHLFYHSFKDVDAKTLFYIVYYGGKRPERSFGIQIYDTKASDVQKEIAYKYRFDILSLLVNVLNPYQTLARFVYNKKEYEQDIELLYGRVNKWNEFNKIDDKFLPNSILPIYSVDLMLKYLKKQFDISEIYSEFQGFSENIKTGINTFIEDFKKDENHSKKEGNPEVGKKGEPEDELIECIINEVFTKSVEGKTKKTVIKEMVDELIEGFKKEYGEELKKELTEELEKEIEKELTEELKKGLKEELEGFKDLLKEEKISLLEEKFNLVDYLREKIEMTLLERIIRNKKFISGYYDKLNDLTSEKLAMIEFEDKKISAIYDNIYKMGRYYFIEKDLATIRSLKIRKIKEKINERRTQR